MNSCSLERTVGGEEHDNGDDRIEEKDKMRNGG